MKQDPNNYRKHSERNKELISKSLKSLGAGRSVLIDSEDYLIAGNGVMEQAEALGIPTRIIETDGTELVVVKRTDLKLGDAKRKELALADNATSDTSEWDVDALTAEWDPIDLEGWDVSVNDWELAEPSEEDLIGEDKVKPPTMRVTFPDPDSLQKCENELKEVLDRLCPDAYYSVSAGAI